MTSLFVLERVNLHACATPNCGAVAALPESVERQYRISHRNFYCSSGHSMAFVGMTESEKRIAVERDRFARRLQIEEAHRREAERIAAQKEDEALKLKRERDTARRTLRRGLKVAEKVIASEKKPRKAPAKKKATKGRT